MSEPLFPHATVIVVRVTGTPTAYHPAKIGWSDILVLERNKLIYGSAQ